jgi:hypothetical protein
MLIAGVIATVVGIFLLDIVATVRVVQSGAYSKSQKLLQISIIWAVPLAGAAIALLVISSDRMTVERRRTSDASDINAYAAAYGNAEASHDHSTGGHGGDIGGGGHAG